MDYGLQPMYENPQQLLAHYRNELEKIKANQEFLDALISLKHLKPKLINVPAGAE